MRKAPLFGAGLVVCLIIALGGLSAAAETTFGLEPLPTRQTLSVGFFSGSPHSIPFYIADKEGFWDELNIDVKYQSFINGPAMMEANASWDIADVGGPGVLVGQLGYDLKMIGVCDYEENLGLFVRKDSPILAAGKGHVPAFPGLYGKPEDWKGTRWLYPIGTNLHMTLAAALRAQGLAINDIESVNMDVSSALVAFRSGSGDGLAVWNAIAFAAEDAGFMRVGDAGLLDVVSTCGLMATDDALANKRELLRKAWQVYYLTWDWANRSEENMKKALAYYLESCEDEGVVSDESIVSRSLALFKCPTPAGAVRVMTDTEPDALGKYTSRQLLRAEKDLLHTLDFFIEQQKYTEADRVKILDNRMVDSSIAVEAEKEFKALGIIAK